MFRGFPKTRLDSEAEELTGEYQDANGRKNMGEPTPQPRSQYRPNRDPSLYLYGKAPRSPLDPYGSSTAQSISQNNGGFQYQYDNPETSGLNSIGYTLPYFHQYVSTRSYTRPSQPTATHSYGAQSPEAHSQGYGPSTTSNEMNDFRTMKRSDRSGEARASRSKHISGSEYGTLEEEYETSKTLENTNYIVDNNSNDDSNGGGTASSHSTARSRSRTASPALPAQGDLKQAEDNTTEDSPLEENTTEDSEDDTDIRKGQGPGRVRWDNGTMVWRENKFENTGEPWHFPREQGLAENDVTCFLHSQKTWDVNDRAHRPAILFQWKKAGHRNPTYVVRDWYHKGMIVLDAQDHPVRKFRNIPDTCSSMLEGGIMEAVKREDGRINHQDFIARMLPQILVEGSEAPKSQPLYGKNAMAARMRRFREKACCIVWGGRAGSDRICDYFETIIPPQCLTANSTRDFRDLYDYEILGIRKINAGKFSERAGCRAINDVKRKLREEKLDSRVDRRKKQFDKEQDLNGKPDGRKRKRAALRDTEDGDEEAETFDMPAAGGNTAPKRKQRKMNHISTIEELRTSGSFVVGDDGDDEERQYSDQGCANPDTNRERQAEQIESTDETELASDHTSQLWPPMMPSADGSIANVAGVQQAERQEFYDAGVNYGSSSALDGSSLATAAVNAVSTPFEVDFSTGYASAEGQSNFYAALYGEPTATYRFDPPDVASEHGDFVGSSFARESFSSNFNDGCAGEQAVAYDVGPLDGPPLNDEVIDTAETPIFCDAFRGEPAAASQVDLPNAAAASNEIHDFDHIFAEYSASMQSNTNVPDIEWGSSLDRPFGDNINGNAVNEDQNLFSGVFFPPYESGDEDHPS